MGFVKTLEPTYECCPILDCRLVGYVKIKTHEFTYPTLVALREAAVREVMLGALITSSWVERTDSAKESEKDIFFSQLKEDVIQGYKIEVCFSVVEGQLLYKQRSVIP